MALVSSCDNDILQDNSCLEDQLIRMGYPVLVRGLSGSRRELMIHEQLIPLGVDTLRKLLPVLETENILTVRCKLYFMVRDAIKIILVKDWLIVQARTRKEHPQDYCQNVLAEIIVMTGRVSPFSSIFGNTLDMVKKEVCTDDRVRGKI